VTARVRTALGVAAALALAGFISTGGQARALSGCRPLRVVVYAATGSTAVAQALASDASPCAQYFVTVPPLAADKTQIRSGVAPGIRALGASFHALAEVNVTAWQGWVTSTGSSWYQAGVEARTRMAAAGFDVSAGDSWALNELSSAVRAGTGTSRQNMRDFVHGLYDADGSQPATKGVAFVTGIGQPTASLGTYKANLESWLQDAGFWSDMSSYVSDFLQETYGDIRDYGVAGADVPTRLRYLNQYLEHVLQLATVAPPAGSAAASYLGGSFAPLANAAWAWSSGFGFTAVPYDQMEDFVSAQVDAMRSYDASLGWSSDSVGFAWDPSNSLGLSSSDFSTETASLLARLAAAIAASADPASPGAGACGAPWCTATVQGAAFTPAWSTFSSWSPTGPAFGSLPQTVTAGTSTGAMNVETQIGGIVTTLPVDTEVEISSSSPGGSFSSSPGGPWTPALELTIPAGAAGAAFYMLDSQTGNPTVTATVGTQTATQIEVVTAPAAPLALSGADNDVTYAEGGPPAAVDPALTVTDSQSATLQSASVALAAGYTGGDALTASTQGTAITAAYASGTLTLTGVDTLAHYQSVLQSVRFSGTTTAGGARTVIWTAGDGTSSASAVTTIAYTAPPSAPVGVAAEAGDGQATVSFDAPGSDGGAQVATYTVTSSPGGSTATGSGSPLTVSGLVDGTTYTFTVTATNAAGTGGQSAPSNAVTPTAPAGGGGGGGGGSGGGGGGGGPGPDLHVSASVSPTPQHVGDQYAYVITVQNTGSTSGASTLTVNLPSQVAFNGSITDRGPGCTASGQTVTCPLDFFPAGLQDTVTIGARVAQPGTLVMTTSTSSSPPEIAPDDGVASSTIQIAAAPAPPTTTPAAPRPTRTAARAAVVLSLSRPKPILLSARHPSVALVVTVSKATRLTFDLRDAGGRKLAHWSRRARKGRNAFVLALPPRARHRGHEILRISETGGSRSKTVVLTLRP